MEFDLAPQERELQVKARDFVEKEVIPHEKGWPLFIDDAPKEVVLSLRKKCREANLVNIDVPKEYGGLVKRKLRKKRYVIMTIETKTHPLRIGCATQ